jgi:Ser/Thr protein kinase RdoA (MazF antagonist)
MWENIKFSQDRLTGIFDFDDCRESFLLEDIAKSIMHDFDVEKHSLFGAGGEKAETFLNNYRSARTLQPAEEHVLPMFFLARFIYQLTAHFLDPPNRRLAGEPGRTDSVVGCYVTNKQYFEFRV